MTDYSYNGWPASPDKNAIDIQPFGDAYGLPFPGGVRGGDVATVLAYVATQLHNRVEQCVSGWDWGYEYRANVNNPSSLSCHASGTAIDYNAPNHPNGARGTFSGAQVGVIRQILNEVQGAVQWGGDYTGTADEMHFEIIVDATTLANVAADLGGVTPKPPTPEDIPMGLIVRRCDEDGTDYGYTDDFSFFLRVPNPTYYANLHAAGVIVPEHDEAERANYDVVMWYRGQVQAAGGRIYEPAE